MKPKIIEIKRGNVVVKIYVVPRIKDGRRYVEFKVADKSTDVRRLLTFSDETDARKKAAEIAEATATGHPGLLALSPYENEIQAAFEALPPGVRLSRAVEIFRSCSQVVEPDEILIACRFWKENRPDKKFIAKKLGEATDDYLARQKHLSARRQRTLASYFKAFTKKFGGKWLHEITTADLKVLIFGKETWKAPKTRNEVRAAIGLLYRDAQEQGHVAKGYDPSASMRWEQIKPGDVGIFMPEQVRQILYSLEDDLALPMAAWFFGGCRKENLIRIPISSFQAALKTGFLKIAAAEDLKTGARTVKLEANLRAWVEWYLSRHPDATGPVLSARYGEGRRLDNLTRKITCRSGVQWEDNGPRHSCLTMWLAKGENVQTVAKWAGNSLDKIQKHYWNRDESITAAVAGQYFAILPPGEGTTVPPPKSGAAAEPKLALPITERFVFANN